MSTSPAQVCVRHPERPTGRRCTRCGRPACPDCLREAAVGSHCVDCLREAQPSPVARASRWVRTTRPVATYAIIAVTVAAFLVIGLSDSRVTGEGPTGNDLALRADVVDAGEWWRLLTHALVHYGALHLLFNMVVLLQVGMLLEPAMGRLRFGLVYVVSILGGAAGALLLDPGALTGGASGGVFGVAAAATLAMQRQGMPFMQTGFGPLLAINLALSFVWPNISLGGHLGGLVAGALATEAIIQARRARLPSAVGVAGVVLVAVVAVVLALSAASNP